MSHPRADVAQAQEVAEPALLEGGCLATLLLSMRTLKIFIFSMGTKLYCAPILRWLSGIARANPCQMLTRSFRSLTEEEVSDYLCHFFDFSSCEGELASNIELVTGMRGWGWHARLLRGALFAWRNHVNT